MEVCIPHQINPRTILLKINGTQCNLRCHYCSEIKKNHPGRFSLAQLETFFSSLDADIDVILHGGEPLLDINFVREVVLLHRRIRNRLVGIQTNAAFSDSMASLLVELKEHIKLGISLDGPEDCNRFRVSPSGEEVFDRINSFLTFADQHQLSIKCIATVSKKNVTRARELLDYFMQHPCISSLRINPCFDMVGGELSSYAITPLQFLNFLTEISWYWIEQLAFQQIRLEPICSSLFRQDIKDDRQSYCKSFLSYYPDGYCTLCDTLGDLKFESSAMDLFEQAQQIELDTNDKFCNNCSSSDCWGGCSGILKRFSLNPDLSQEYCEYRKGFKSLITSIAQFFE